MGQVISVNYEDVGGKDTVVAYDSGTWDTSLKPYFNMYLVTENSDHLLMSASYGGFWINDVNFMKEYSGVLFIPSADQTSFTSQVGRCTLTASLPTIMSGGTGRLDYSPFNWDKNVTQTAGHYYGAQTATKIQKILLVK